MMYPILCKVRYETLHRSFREKSLWIQVAFSVVVNWVIAPFFMVCANWISGESVLTRAYSLPWHGHSCLMNEVSEKA
jgi:ACR3 family arsenite efflux pump ArsB